MAKRLLFAMAITTAITVLYVVAMPSPSGPNKSLEFIIASELVRSNGVASAPVVVSNVSNCPVEYAGGFGSAWLEVGVSTNGVWRYEKLRTPGGGLAYLGSHRAFSQCVPIPPGVTRWKIGLAITSLTWRGKSAWRMLPDPGVFRPICGYLLAKDERSRSVTEWSVEYIIAGDTAIRDRRSIGGAGSE